MFALQKSTSSTNLGFCRFFFSRQKNLSGLQCLKFTNAYLSRSVIKQTELSCLLLYYSAVFSQSWDLLWIFRVSKVLWKRLFSLCLSQGLRHTHNVGVGGRERRTPNHTKNSFFLSPRGCHWPTPSAYHLSQNEFFSRRLPSPLHSCTLPPILLSPKAPKTRGEEKVGCSDANKN